MDHAARYGHSLASIAIHPAYDSKIQRQEDDEEPSGGAESADVDGGASDAGGVTAEIDTVDVECDAADAVGFGGGGGKSVSLHGKTDANYNHGRPIPAPFPSGVTVTTKSVGKSTVFSANGTFDAAFTASPSVTLPPVPGGLTPCQQKAVQAFISGPLTAHEQDHVKAFTSNYNGKATLTVSANNILDTPTNRSRAIENPVNAEDQTRVATANKASGALDPWNQTIPGLDCED